MIERAQFAMFCRELCSLKLSLPFESLSQNLEERTSLRKGSEPQGHPHVWKGESHFGVDIGGKIRTRRTGQCSWLLKGSGLVGTPLVMTLVDVDTMNWRCPSFRNLRSRLRVWLVWQPMELGSC